MSPQAEVSKTQGVRGFDVLILGPLLMRFARHLPGWKGELLWLFGAGTIVYNLANLLEQARREGVVKF
jgi:hypothetical protein